MNKLSSHSCSFSFSIFRIMWPGSSTSNELHASTLSPQMSPATNRYSFCIMYTSMLNLSAMPGRWMNMCCSSRNIPHCSSL